MAKTTDTTVNSKEDIRMPKYTRVTTEQKNNQKVSSGDIRENGKLVSRFNDPVSYRKLTLQSTDVTRRTHSEHDHEEANTKRNEIGTYLLDITWREFGEPVFRSSLQTLKDVVIGKIKHFADQDTQQKPLNTPESSDVESDEIEPTDESNNVVRFSSEKAI